MRERPILFSSPMVRAILDGTKTQTRRLVKPAPSWTAPPNYGCVGGKGFGFIDGNDVRKAPCEPGDWLWVRETWNREGGAVTYRADGDWIADYAAGDADDYARRKARGMHPRWKPSLFMRREDSRITLEVTSVRVERLNDISQRDAVAEGVDACERCYGGWPGGVHSYVEHGREVLCPICGGSGYKGTTAAFRALWDSINGKRCPWSSNPWVWVIGFQRVDSLKDALSAGSGKR